ncbi:MAG: MBOAT family O-acyltransferase [Lachnospiraceae bacterium]
MIFSSTIFLFMFLPITLIGYFMLRGELRNYWLLLVSLVFFAWSQPNYLWIILLNIAVNYVSALLLKYRKTKKLVLVLCMLVNVGLLGYFKYFDFAIASINSIFQQSFGLRNIILPIGISFFTFQGISYVIDVYRDTVPVQKNIFKLGLYIVLFPQLIAGPIVRYSDIVNEIDCRQILFDDFISGVERFIIGLGKKSIIANTMAVIVDSIWETGAGNSVWTVAWLGSIAYTLQIYFDFSGYSDMAIGLGKMFGFHFNENFNLPYISKNISEFWRRWHISLSSWFRDYIYIPLGGNRRHVYFNLAVVFVLTGVWHGASWTFVAWGIWNGFFVLLERFVRNHKKTPASTTKKSFLKSCLGHIYVFLVVNLGFVLFRADSIANGLLYIQNMFGKMPSIETGYTLASCYEVTFVKK